MHTLLIDGQDVPGAGEVMESRNPADESLVGCTRAATAAQTAEAVDAAAQAWTVWRAKSEEQRIAVARRLAAILERERDSLADLISREVGKPLWEAQGEITTSIAKVELSIGALQQRRPPTNRQLGAAEAQVRYRSLGPVIVLGPYNFPVHLPGGQIIPALLAGNTIVFKPSESTPVTGRWLADAWRRAGAPDGVLNLVQGGVPVAEAAIDHRSVQGVMFTGSHRAGEAIHRRLAGRTGVLLALEMGGNSALLAVEPLEPERVAGLIVASAFVTAGQRCTCARRLIVVDGAPAGALLDALENRVSRLRIGLPGDEPEPFVGPLVSAAAADALLSAQEAMIAAGGKPLCTMQRSPRSAALVTPGIIDVTGTSAVHDDEEHFGPLLRVIRARSFEEGVLRAGESRFGLAAALIGGTREQFEAFRDAVPAGVVNWNRQTTGASGSLPFGGLRDSGNHRPMGFWAVDACNDPVASLVAERIDDEDFDRSQL